MNTPNPYFTSEDGAFVLFHGDMVELLPRLDMTESVPLVVTDPPYFLSSGGTTCQSGKRSSVDKGRWDRPESFSQVDHTVGEWLYVIRSCLSPDGTIWCTGTEHIAHIIGYNLQRQGYRILNEVIWEKPAPPPNLGCRCLTHSTEMVIWAAATSKSKYTFDYKAAKQINGGRQLKNVWTISPPRKAEKVHGKHPTQKPLELVERIVLLSSNSDELVLDPFTGSSSTGIAAIKHGRRFVGIDSEREYLDLSISRYKTEILGE